MSQSYTKGTPIDTDPTLAANSDIVVPSQKAVKSYVASQVGTPVTAVNATAPILSSGGTTPNLSIPLATNSVDGYLSAADRTAFNAKQAAITGAATTITSSDLTASRALISNASGKVAISTVTDTELGYVSGVTSSIQTQLNSVGATYSAYTMKANNTAATAAPNNFNFKDLGDQALPVTVTWQNTAPSGTTTLRYRWFQIGNVVQYFFFFNYSVAGTNNATILFDLPLDMPTPAVFTGSTGAGNYIYRGIALVSTGPTIPTTGTSPVTWGGGLRRDGTNTKYEFFFTNGAFAAARTFSHSGFYFST